MTDKTIWIGIGNSGRKDDGIGWACLDQFRSLFPGITAEYRYQLQIEDAELISKYDHVIFIDASMTNYETGYKYYRLKPIEVQSYTSHALHPGQVLQLCAEIYQQHPKAYMLEVTGSEWGLELGLSEEAQLNIQNAMIELKETISSKNGQILNPH